MYNRALHTYVDVCMHVYAPALEATAPTGYVPFDTF